MRGRQVDGQRGRGKGARKDTHTLNLKVCNKITLIIIIMFIKGGYPPMHNYNDKVHLVNTINDMILSAVSEYVWAWALYTVDSIQTIIHRRLVCTGSYIKVNR